MTRAQYSHDIEQKTINPATLTACCKTYNSEEGAFVKPVIRILAAGLMCCLGSAAHAAIVTYTFEAKVSSITEQIDPHGAFVKVAESSVAGTPVALGDILAGSFQYDTSVKLSSYEPTQQPGSVYRMYESGVNDYVRYVDKNTGLAFTSLLSQNWIGNSIQDSTPVPGGYAPDFFSIRRIAVDDTMSANAGIWLDDLYGNAFQSTAMPTEINLGLFQYASVDSAFLRLSDDAFMLFSADIISLERVEVPEPDSAALFAIAAGGLFGLRRMRRTTRA